MANIMRSGYTDIAEHDNETIWKKPDSHPEAKWLMEGRGKLCKINFGSKNNIIKTPGKHYMQHPEVRSRSCCILDIFTSRQLKILT